MALFTGTVVIDLEETDSTNNYALNLLREKQPFEGTVVRTFRQTLGRGQRNKHWESEDFSNLTFSIIFYPAFLSVSRQFQLSKAIALGVADFVKTILKTENVKIKWPNDIYVGDKKIAGMLIENTVNGNKISSSVAGIGLNVNQEKFSPDIPNPVSLKMMVGNNLDLENCFQQLCVALETRYMQLKTGKENLIDEQYHKTLYGLNEQREFIIENKNVNAQIIGVDELGRLKLYKNGGSINVYDLNQVIFKI
ncbi:MAG: Bifunctional ligase/repressor BirA [Bacteroidia bacterium]|nr:Bifunctional ligase/repressor BirA [Bacteroidia bacterium]